MKSILRIIGVVLLSAFLFTSCSKKSDPANADIFAGTFKGKIGFTGDGKNFTYDHGSVFVTKVGSRYDFGFSDAIPDLRNVEFKQQDDHTLISIGDAGTGIITINKDKLVIGFNRDGKSWTADCTR